jgi:hypothetical protein
MLRRALENLDRQVGLSIVSELSWRWILLMLTVPPVAGAVMASLFWRKREMILGNLVGTMVIFGAGVVLIVRESIEVNGAIAQCLNAGYTCWPVPSAFVRYSIYAFIALAEVIALFNWSLRIETRMRNRLYAPEWR